MKMTAPSCRCGGVFACVSCERTLRKQLATMHEVDHLMHTGGNSGVHRFFDEATAQKLFASRPVRGPRGGAMLDVGNAIELEVWLPYEEPGGVALPFMPMPLVGHVIHDVGRKKENRTWELQHCLRGTCQCDSRPTGWLLTRAIVRAMLDVSDAWLNEHGRQLPGQINSSWELRFDTVSFMRDLYFNPTFVLPTRAESREMRAERTNERSAGRWTHDHPEHVRRGTRRR